MNDSQHVKEETYVTDSNSMDLRNSQLDNYSQYGYSTSVCIKFIVFEYLVNKAFNY